MNTTNEMEAAQMIASQIGNSAFAMLGAAGTLMASVGCLRFRVRGSKKVSEVRVVLSENDSYTVEFYKGRGINIREVGVMTGVQAEELRQTVATVTGLAVAL